MERRRRQPSQSQWDQDRLPLAVDAYKSRPHRHHRKLCPTSGGKRRSNRTKTKKQIFPRYQKLDVTRKLLADVGANGAGRRYLIQHSPGSGKSNSIAWLGHQLVGLEQDSEQIFDSVIVVTDRRLLDQQIRDTIRQFAQVGAIVGHAESSADLRQLLESGKKIIITTVQKFPFILDAIGDQHRNSKFAIIIDEAHSSQGGRTAAKMNIALSSARAEEKEETTEDVINRIMEARKMLANASYFAFTATPKNKTLEVFGEPGPDGGVIKHRPFHIYSMKQAIHEGFILDVLKSYTPVDSYYRLAKTVEEDPEHDTKKVRKKLRQYVESNQPPSGRSPRSWWATSPNRCLANRKLGAKPAPW